jgi:hypothetical protein
VLSRCPRCLSQRVFVFVVSETQEAVKEEQEGTLSVAAKLREAEATKEIYKVKIVV